MATSKPITTKKKRQKRSSAVPKSTSKSHRDLRSTKSKSLKVRKKSAVIYAKSPAWRETLVKKLHHFLATAYLAKKGMGLAIKHSVAKLKKQRGDFQYAVKTQLTSVRTNVHNQLSKLPAPKLPTLPVLPLPKFPKFKLPFKAKPTKPSKSTKKKKKSKFVKGVTKVTAGTHTFFSQEIFGSFHYLFRYHFLIMLISLLISAGILVGAYEVYDIAFKDLPSVDQLATRQQSLTTKIYDRNGKLLYGIYKDQNRSLIPLSQVPQDLIHATISIEDRNFFTHRGISIRGIFRALVSNAQGGNDLQGGSTITQQLVKNTLLTPERTFKRKVREIVLAFMVEGTYSKNEILEMYFNEVGYGGSTYGVEEASETYFGKPVQKLDLAESAMIAGLPQSPTQYSPFGSTPELAYNRQHEVLQRMVEDKYITQAQADAAKTESLKFKQDKTDIQAPHFVMYIKSLLEKQYGTDVVNEGGLEVKTTLDLDTQNQAQKIVTDEVNNLARLHITNGAAVMTNPQTGEILAMVGSKDYFDFKHDGQVNVTTRPRQPGSSIKPLTYAISLEQGKTPESTILDEPTVFSSPGSPPYAPRNYDGKFHGLVTLRTALACSFNIPAVKTLAEIGIPTMIDKAQQMGITTWTDRKRFGLSLTLGGGEVLMVDMAQVYGTFATYGNTVTLNPIMEIKNSKGEVLYENICATNHQDCPAVRTLDAKVAYQISDILSDNNARIPEFGAHSVLYIPGQQVPVKTGTTNNLKDNWTIGYTQNRLVAVWVGNNDGSPMSYVASGITGASPIWNKIIRTQLDDAHPSSFPVPDGLIKVAVCTATNTLPCAGCPQVSEELFVPGTEPKAACYFAPVSTVPQGSQGQAGGQNQNQQNRDKILNGITTVGN